MAMTLAALKAEILNDPQTYGYAAAITAGEPETVAALLNKLRDGTDGETAISIRRATILPMELMEAIDLRDLQAVGTVDQALVGSWLESILQSVQPIRLLNADGTNTRVRGNLNRILANTQGSQARFDAIAVRVGSRAEQLFGEGVTISPTDVGMALRS